MRLNQVKLSKRLSSSVPGYELRFAHTHKKETNPKTHITALAVQCFVVVVLLLAPVC